MSTSSFTVIVSPYGSGNPAPANPKDFAIAVKKLLSNRLPSFVPLDQFIDPYEATSQIRGVTYSDKHVRDLKSSIKESGLEEAIVAIAFTDESGNEKALIVEGNHRFKAISELFDEDDENEIPTQSGKPEIKAFVLEEEFFGSDAERTAFQLYMNKPVLKKPCSPEEVIGGVGEMISGNVFGNVATASEGVIEANAKAFVRETYPTMSRKQVSDAVSARASATRNKRRLTHNFTKPDARNFKSASRTVLDGKDRGDYVISPMVVSNDGSDFNKAVGEIVNRLAALKASGGAGALNVKVKMVAKTSKSTDADIDAQRAKLRGKKDYFNAYSQAAMGRDIIDELLFLPEKTNESKERRLKRFV